MHIQIPDLRTNVGNVRDTCLCPIRHKHVYLADQIMPRSSLSPTFPLGKSPCHVCPTRHNPDMGCFSLLVPSRSKGEAYDRARLYTHLCDYPLAARVAGAPPGYPRRHSAPARVCPRQYPADVACWRTVWAVAVPT